MYRLCQLLLLLISANSLYAASNASVIRMDAISGLKYSYQTFYVKPGTEVELYLSNQDTMLHNLVITKPGKRLAVVNAATALGAEGAAMDYIPTTKDVLWAIPVVAQSKTKKIRFIAPAKAGEYPFVCTFPGHGTFMFGSMVVTHNLQSPIKNTANPATQASSLISLNVPTVRRLFMPDSGPASIAVALPDNYSYTWDAGSVGLRYVWKGGFIKDLHQWPSPRPTSTPEIEGDVIYREPLFSVRGADIEIKPNYQFLGYRLDKQGYPTFHYMINNMEVKESIRIQNDRMVRRFITQAEGRLQFKFSKQSSTNISVSMLPGSKKEYVVRQHLGEKNE
jgi:azurin